MNVKKTSGPSGVHWPGVSSLAVIRLNGKSPPAEMSRALAHVSFSVGAVVIGDIRATGRGHAGGQQPSPSTHTFCRLPWLTHAAVHVPPFTSAGSTQPICGHDVGQLPARAVSQVSPPSTTPLPHTAAQSPSLLRLQAPRPPPGQQPSPAVHAVIAACVQATLQLAFAPVRASVVHELPSLHVMAGTDYRRRHVAGLAALDDAVAAHGGAVAVVVAVAGAEPPPGSSRRRRCRR